MLFTRKIGKILRGKATPLQITMACVLGSMIGFVPGFMNGPGLMIALILLLVILNANLAVALAIGTLAKLLGLALMPVSFQIGRVLLDVAHESSAVQAFVATFKQALEANHVSPELAKNLQSLLFVSD